MSKFDLDSVRIAVEKFFTVSLAKISSDTLNWLAAILIHVSVIPSLLAVMSGLTDNMPPLDMVLFMWAALALLFVKSIITKDTLNIITIGIGFIVQCTLMGLMLFK